MRLALILAAVFAAPPTGGAARGTGSSEAYVELDDASWLLDLPPDPEDAIAEAFSAQREVHVAPHPDGMRVRVTWTFEGPRRRPGRTRAPAPAAKAWTLLALNSSVRVVSARERGAGGIGTSREPAVLVKDGALTYVQAATPGRRTLDIELLIVDAQREGALSLLPASVGRVTTDEAMTLELTDAAGAALPRRGRRITWGGPELRWAAPRPRGQEGDLVLAHVGVGVTIDDVQITTKARVRFEVRRGELRESRIELGDVGDDLRWEVPAGVSVTREGTSLRVRPDAPLRDGLAVGLQWSQSTTTASIERAQISMPRPTGVWRTESWLQVARGDEIEIFPDCANCRRIAAGDLPGFARDLVTGTPLVAYANVHDAAVDLVRFVPLEEPAVLVDLAEYRVATTEEGRAILSVRYLVRNDRAAHLALRLPPRQRLLGVRIDDATAVLGRTADGEILIPLPRSLETVEGLLSFPVEISGVSEGDEGWNARNARAIAVPAINAPIAVARSYLVLPPAHRERKRRSQHRVDRFDDSRGIAFGFQPGDVRGNTAEHLYREAVRAWLDNDFDAAQGKLDEVRGLGAIDDNIEKLQSNLDVVAGVVDETKLDASKQASVRRVKAQARARGRDAALEQQKNLAAAKDAELRGDYEEASREYKSALTKGETLARLEDSYAFEQQAQNEYLVRKVEENRRAREVDERWAEGEETGGKRKAAKKTTGDFRVRDAAVTRAASPPAALPAGDVVSQPRRDRIEEEDAELGWAEISPDAPRESTGGYDIAGVDVIDASKEESPRPAQTSHDNQAAATLPPAARTRTTRVDADRRSADAGPQVESDGKRALAPTQPGEIAGPAGGEPEPGTYLFDDDTIAGEVVLPSGMTLEREFGRTRDPTADPAPIYAGVATTGSRTSRMRAVRGGGGGRGARQAAPQTTTEVSDMPAAAQPPPPSLAAPPEDQNAYEDLDEAVYAQAERVVDLRKGPLRPRAVTRLAGRSSGKAKAKARAPTTPLASRGRYAPPERALPSITASQMSITVPVAGQELRFEQLLLPAGQAPELRVQTRRHRRGSNRVR